MAITTKCHHKCAAGRDCACNGAIPHVHHICRDAACRCHTAEAYGLEAVAVKHQAVYVPLARRLEAPDGSAVS